MVSPKYKKDKTNDRIGLSMTDQKATPKRLRYTNMTQPDQPSEGRNINDTGLFYRTADKRLDFSQNLLGTIPKNTTINVDGQIIGEERPSDHIKSVGRPKNILDNMDRKFILKGYSPNTKLDLWDMVAIADTH